MPMIQERQAEMEGLLMTANAMAVAARTAPKARGVDAIETLIVHGDRIQALSRAMVEHGKAMNKEAMFARDARNVLDSQVVVLIGLKDLGPKKPEKPLDCGACGHANCAGFLEAERSEGDDFPGPVCVFQSMDLGIALSSACALAARFHVDNRMMYTIGGPARRLKWMRSEIIIGIPLSCSGKNIYFDRA